jgi:stage IV sporulation protein B
VGGEAFGIKLYTRGVLVAKTDVVTTQNGNENPAQAAGLRSGDIITEIDGNQVNRKSEVSRAIENSGGTPLRMTVERGGSVLYLDCTPVKGAGGDKYIAGLWVRDSSAGIGTVTFYDKKSGTIAGLRHAICDVDSGEIIPISGGELVSAKVMGCYKGADGAPGELCGVFEPQVLAALEVNGDAGVYGEIGGEIPDGGLLPVALKSEVKPGPAQIAVTVAGKEKRYYDVEITKVSSNLNSVQKNMTLRVTDPDLIEATGGIVQGMSGSPIIQGGMLVGAVTHVFVNSPLEGYAIFAETMLETARDAAQRRG